MKYLKKTTYGLIILMIALLAGGLYYFLREESFLATPSVQTEETDNTTQISYVGNTIVEEKDGKRLWELSAENIQVDSKNNQVTLQQVRGILYREDGTTLNLTTPVVLFNTQTKFMVMPQPFTATTSDGATFLANQAEWNGQTKVLVGKGNVKLTHNDTVVTGDLIQTTDTLEKIKVQGNAHVQKGGANNAQ